MDWLVEIAGGWLGWSPDVYRFCHLQDIHLAYAGKVKLLKACYGTSEEDGKGKNLEVPATLENFDRIFNRD